MYYLLLAFMAFGCGVLAVDWTGAKDPFGVVFWVVFVASFLGLDWIRGRLHGYE